VTVNDHLPTILPALAPPHYLQGPLLSRSTPRAPRLTPPRRDQRGQGVADPSPLATACYRPPNWKRPNGARSRVAAPLCQYVTKPGDCCGQIDPFLPTRCRTTVEHSIVAGGAQCQWLQECLPNEHKAHCLSLSNLLEWTVSDYTLNLRQRTVNFVSIYQEHLLEIVAGRPQLLVFRECDIDACLLVIIGAVNDLVFVE
jgi:hypothetical protein